MLFKIPIAVIMPAFRSKRQIIRVLQAIGPEVKRIYVVDDACPEKTGQLVLEKCKDPRVTVLFHEKNLGVGGAVITGYRAAIADGMEILVKIDSDGQMDPRLLMKFVKPIMEKSADYTKGNRFFAPEGLRSMPLIRVLGNGILSIMSKLSTGYWHVFDPTNGYTAIHANVLDCIQIEKVSSRYFFESDILFRLNLSGAVVMDVPMSARYDDEESNLKIKKIIFEFLVKHTRNLLKRIIYNYYLRGFSVGSVELAVGLVLISLGSLFGAHQWMLSIDTEMPATSGSVMLSALPVILGFQSLLGFINYDVSSVPNRPIYPQICNE